MKNKKTTSTALLLLLTAALAFTGCSKQKDPKEILDEASAKHAELTEMDMNMDMDMTMEQGENSLSMSTVTNMLFTGLNTEDMLYLADMTIGLDMEEFSQEMDMTMFYKDGYCYMETMGQKMKYVMDLESMMETMKESTAATNLTSDFMTDLSLTEDGDNTIISFTGDPEKMNEYVTSTLGMLEEQLTSEDMNISITDITGDMTISKDGYCTEENMVMIYSMEIPEAGEDPLIITATIHAAFNNPGQPVEITLPEDLDSYFEIDAELAEQLM